MASCLSAFGAKRTSRLDRFFSNRRSDKRSTRRTRRRPKPLQGRNSISTTNSASGSPRNNYGVWGTSISLGARLCRLAARLAHSCGCGIRHQPRVAENRAELVSLAETSNGRLGSIGMHARDLTALAVSRADGLDRRQHFRILRIEGRRLRHAEREVRGSDIDTVETLDRDDLIEVLHGLARLDHGEDENFVIRVLPIVGAAIEKRA